jgi:hypothetical protein
MFTTKAMLGKLCPATAIIAACAGIPSTADAMTVSLGTPSLTSRVAITEPVTVACSPFDSSLTLASENIHVDVEQAAGKAIAHGSATNGSFLPALLFTCDGSQRSVPMTLYADPTGPPFRGGQAVFTVAASASAATPCFPGSTTCFTSPIAGQSATQGPTALNLH